MPISTQIVTYVVAPAVPPPVVAAPVSPVRGTPRLNIGTLAPSGSGYHQSLQNMADQWRSAPGGGVALRIFPDGTQGSEADMVKLMNSGKLQGALLTSVGLARIDRSVGALEMLPMMFRSVEEVDFVSQRLRPRLKKALSDSGYVVLFWVETGWERYFSKQPIRRPEDLMRMKLFARADNMDQLEIMKKHGYTLVPLETGDILISLKTGLIDTVAAPPIWALAGQLDTTAPHMLNLNWTPLVCICVVRRDSWERIPDPTRQALLTAAAKAGADIQAKGRKEGENAVVAMKKRGLIIEEVTPEVEAQFRAEAAKLYPDIRGRMIPADLFDEVVAALTEFRSREAPSK